MKDAYIYGLVDPRTSLIRYVGKSVEPKMRFKGHITGCNRTDTYCARWIRSLKKAGLQPELVILEGPCENWEEAERRWIAQLGPQLTNLTSGGEGLHDLVRTPEHCAAIGRANARRVYTDEMRANNGKAQKERFARLTPEERYELQALRVRAARKRGKWDKPMSDKGRANIAAARLGTKRSLESRAKQKVSLNARLYGPNGTAERQKTANFGEKNGRYGKPYTAPKASCVKCRRVVAVHALHNHHKACQAFERAKELVLFELAEGPKAIRDIRIKIIAAGITAGVLGKVAKSLELQRLSAPPAPGLPLWSLPGYRKTS